MEFRFLTDEFFYNFPLEYYSEIERKKSRPYAHVGIVNIKMELVSYTVAIPIRSNINHQFAIFSSIQLNKGLDLSKMLIIDPKYIDITKVAFIDDEEFRYFLEKEFYIKKKVESFIKNYIKKHRAYQLGKIEKENVLLYSTLKYFHRELGIN